MQADREGAPQRLNTRDPENFLNLNPKNESKFKSKKHITAHLGNSRRRRRPVHTRRAEPVPPRRASERWRDNYTFWKIEETRSRQEEDQDRVASDTLSIFLHRSSGSPRRVSEKKRDQGRMRGTKGDRGLCTLQNCLKIVRVDRAKASVRNKKHGENGWEGRRAPPPCSRSCAARSPSTPTARHRLSPRFGCSPSRS